MALLCVELQLVNWNIVKHCCYYYMQGDWPYVTQTNQHNSNTKHSTLKSPLSFHQSVQL